MKRFFDIVCAALCLILLAPLMAVVGALVRMDSDGPSIYRSPRVGLRGTVFNMFKFRTMIAGADTKGALITTAHDNRITRLGRFLRRSKLDELPSLVNVLRGEMSLVGPRPENPRSASLYTAEQRRLFDVRPGITSLASIKYVNEESILSAAGGDVETAYQAILNDKLQIELDYLKKQHFMTDLRIIALTVKAIFS